MQLQAFNYFSDLDAFTSKLINNFVMFLVEFTSKCHGDAGIALTHTVSRIK